MTNVKMRTGVVLHTRPLGHADRQATWVLVPDAAVVPMTRKRLRRRLASWGVGDADVAELLVSELVTNAMRHSWGAVMSLSLEQGTIRCEVQDTNPALPRVCEAHDGDEGGRGMFLMEALSTAWGSYRMSTGKVVWFELPAADPGD
ncbi:ATP-binding protein [Sphaerisporangium krabiense]|uniref:Anti-sigma regulatory factor (Ser/Thr protein kinase) n=1 Tax=Sphaerisporangium krabiense TaxID=763782 RepID=A0A7W9DNJ7_9ACTN|nr:ATP-binding protein [Sphaerisporangium krabiense]MBB5625418.1 anti-sigma regulatory factor (Ser/Thr protein kinase) [Sphaerisporangium krabiense]